MLPKTIQEVIDQLEEIIQESIRQNSPMGLFPSLYKKVTIKVQEGIKQDFFQKPKRMEMLDVVFANRYILAHQQYLRKEACSQAWQTAFDAVHERSLILLQHLLLGMNAHINLDLGIAAAQICTKDTLEDLHHDFNQINVILGHLIDEVKNEIASVSPMMYLVEWVMKNREEVFAKFSMDAARDFAWLNANNLVSLSQNDQQLAIQQLDYQVAKFGHFITRPGILLGLAVRITKFMENKDTLQQIEALQ